MRLSWIQKQELAEQYMSNKNMSFGNSVADEAAKQMFIDALSHREELYEHTISEFKDAWLELLKTTWEYQFQYLQNQNK